MTDLVRVYRNLHRNCLSVQRYTKGIGWRVVDHTTDVYLSDVTFKVSKAGRERVLQTGKKNVHAFAIGTPINSTPIMASEQVTYNPRKYTNFVSIETGKPVTSARIAHVATNAIHVGV